MKRKTRASKLVSLSPLSSSFKYKIGSGLNMLKVSTQYLLNPKQFFDFLLAGIHGQIPFFLLLTSL